MKTIEKGGTITYDWKPLDGATTRLDGIMAFQFVVWGADTGVTDGSVSIRKNWTKGKFISPRPPRAR